MQTRKSKLLADAVRRLLRRGAIRPLDKILGKVHGADLAAILRVLSSFERRRLIAALQTDERRADLLVHADRDIAAECLEEMGVAQAAELLRRMPSDDEADLIAEFDEDFQKKVLEALKPAEQEEIEVLLQYQDSTAGGIMSPAFFAMTAETTVGEAIERLRSAKHEDIEAAYYVYVVNEHGHLVGVVSLRQLVIVANERTLGEIMNPDVISVHTHEDQEDVAKLVANYDLLAVPVVDEASKLVGVATVDDIIDVFREEATEDMLKMAGAGQEMSDPLDVAKGTRARLPWLLASWIGGVIVAYVVGFFEHSLDAILPLAAFLPVILNLGGTTGNQSATLVVRGLAIGRIDLKHVWSLLGRQIIVGLLLGLSYGLLLGLFGLFRYHGETSVDPFMLALTVGTATAGDMAVAALIGSSIPMLLARLRVDPAVATNPFVSTTMDMVGVVIYFGIASAVPLVPG